MILGLSHVALSCNDIKAATERLAKFGYQQRFDEPSLENHRAKKPFLSHHQPWHHIRALSAEGAMAIELLDHGRLVGSQSSALIPVLRSDIPCPDWQARSLESLPILQDGLSTLCKTLGQVPQAFYDPILSMVVLWIPAKDKPAGLYACAIPSKAPEATARLLEQLRFRPDAFGLWSLLTPLPSLQARLIPVLTRQAVGWTMHPDLDAPGSSCLAFMARGTRQMLLPDVLQKNTVSFDINVNGKKNLITLARPNDGPIIELVDQFL